MSRSIVILTISFTTRAALAALGIDVGCNLFRRGNRHQFVSRIKKCLSDGSWVAVAVVLSLTWAGVVHAGGNIEGPWWKADGDDESAGKLFSLVIEKDLFAGDRQEAFLAALRNQYGEDGLQVCFIDADGKVAERNRFLQIDPTGLDRVPPSPILQIWTSGECIFDGSGRRIGLDIVRQLVQKHFDGVVDNTVAYGGEKCGSDWFRPYVSRQLVQ